MNLFGYQGFWSCRLAFIALLGDAVSKSSKEDHPSRQQRALDLGCATGQANFEPARVADVRWSMLLLFAVQEASMWMAQIAPLLPVWSGGTPLRVGYSTMLDLTGLMSTK